MLVSAKHIKLWGIGAMSKTINFKWQWAVFYEQKAWNQERFYSAYRICPTRKMAREFSRLIKKHPDIKKVRFKRRLIQANWDDYNDSYGWNAGRGL